MSGFRLEKVSVSSNGMPILLSLDAVFSPGLIHTIIGPSGSGKSTLLLLLNRLIDPSAGDIYLDGQNITSLDVIELRRRVGIVFQQPILFPGTVEMNVAYGPSLQGGPADGESARLLDLVGLESSFLTRDAATLSGGEGQRAAIARALANHPQVLLLDEPTSALDARATEQIESLIWDLNGHLGLTVLWVTHDLEQARRIGHHTLLLAYGQKVEDGDTQQLFTNPQERATLLFLEKQLEEADNEHTGDDNGF